MADDILTDASVEPAQEPVAEPAPAGIARIVVKRNGAETSDSFEIHPPAVIGRFDPMVGPIEVDLSSLPEAGYVSRKHAKITSDGGVYTITDLNSSNGTFVLVGEGADAEFKREETATLASGTEFALGNARFVFHIDSPVEASAEAGVAEPHLDPEPEPVPEPSL